VESLLIAPEPEQPESQLRFSGGSWKIKDAIRMLGQTQGVEYTLTYLPLSEAQEQASEMLLERQHGDGISDERESVIRASLVECTPYRIGTTTS
jgi:hypothetical protein